MAKEEVKGSTEINAAKLKALISVLPFTSSLAINVIFKMFHWL